MANLGEQFGGFGSVDDFRSRENLNGAPDTEVLALYTAGFQRYREAVAAELGVPVEGLRDVARNGNEVPGPLPSPVSGTKYAIN